MKVRVCPKCRKHNLENAWSCIDCGATLSVKTLVDIEEAQSSAGPIAGQPELSNISPYFAEDVEETLAAIAQGGELVIHGCNATQLTTRAPYKFGYLVLTSRRLVCVEFTSDQAELTASRAASRGASLLLNPLKFMAREAVGGDAPPKRSCLQVWPTRSSRTPSLAVDCPQYPLTPTEKASRKVATHELENLVSADVTETGYQEICLMSLAAKFRQGQALTVSFYDPEQAVAICKPLQARLRK
jgi:hypothetical protein